MTQISREELLKLAKQSQLAFNEDEIVPLLQQLHEVLTYAHRVNEIAQEGERVVIKRSNVYREDSVQPCDPDLILKEAPQSEAHYFVVPSIIDTN